jgi:type III restriction enzyme
VCDSTWEATEAHQLDRSPLVDAWAKNDHLSFEIFYVFNGVVQRYRPDFLIRLSNHTMLVLEVKGQDLPRDRTKRQFLDEWVRAVNGHAGFGAWSWDVSFDPGDVADVLVKHALQRLEPS